MQYKVSHLVEVTVSSEYSSHYMRAKGDKSPRWAWKLLCLNLEHRYPEAVFAHLLDTVGPHGPRVDLQTFLKTLAPQ